MANGNLFVQKCRNKRNHDNEKSEIRKRENRDKNIEGRRSIYNKMILKSSKVLVHALWGRDR